MEDNENGQKKPLDKKMIIVLGILGVAIIAFIMMSSSGKPKKAKAPQKEQTEQIVDVFADMDEGPAKETDAPAMTGQIQETQDAPQESDMTVQPAAPAAPAAEEPIISGDTLIYDNTIYIRVGYVEKPKPDTVVIAGKKYVEVMQ